jgi:enoyl-CoA hydratase/carnithine racemase
MAEAYEEILVEKDGFVETITLNVPEKLNPITFVSLYELITEIERAEMDDEVRSIIFTGAGRGFSSGADLSRAAEDGPIYREKLGSRKMAEYPGGVLSYAIQRIGQCRKPTIAAVNGVCVAAGLALVLGCDIRLAAEKARFSTIFTKRAMVVHAGMSYYLPRVVGVSRALEMLWTDRFVMSDEAKEIGLVSAVHEQDELMPAALELAKQIAAGPTITLELDKKLIWGAIEAPDLFDAMEREAWGGSVARDTEDSKEGMASFMERREPVFQGR